MRCTSQMRTELERSLCCTRFRFKIALHVVRRPQHYKASVCFDRDPLKGASAIGSQALDRQSGQGPLPPPRHGKWKQVLFKPDHGEAIACKSALGVRLAVARLYLQPNQSYRLRDVSSRSNCIRRDEPVLVLKTVSRARPERLRPLYERSDRRPQTRNSAVFSDPGVIVGFVGEVNARSRPECVKVHPLLPQEQTKGKKR